MAQKNDERIMQLKEKIAENKARLACEQGRFYPVTNCMLTIGEKQYNIRAEENLELLLIRVNMYIISANDLGIDPAEIKVSGYSMLEWKEDIKQLIEVRNHKKKVEQLKKMEKQLDDLLSEEKRAELEINWIESLLI